MSIFVNAIQSLRQQPRAIQWSIIAALGIALFLIWDQGIAPITQSWKYKADAIQAKVQQVNSSAELIQKFDALKDKISGIGPIDLPSSEFQGRQAIQKVINNLLKDHVISQQRFGISEGRMRRGTLASVTGAKRLESLKVDLDFVSTPQESIKIIATLESSPEIEFINTVRMTKAPNKKVKVKLTFETWVLGS
ncbi:MAG: hypothetical protein O7G85_11165 [Planctomycetota bacterium]|nr:hypothetical protein [Planctomycetota bacterium]